MKKKTKRTRNTKGRPSLVGFLIQGAWYDILRFSHLVMIPVHYVSLRSAKRLERWGLNYERTHTALCFMVGGGMLVFSFWLEEHWHGGFATRCTTETIQATAACPMGEILYVVCGLSRKM